MDDIENNIINKLETGMITKLNKVVHQIHNKIQINDSKLEQIEKGFIREIKIISFYCAIILIQILFLYVKVFKFFKFFT